MEYFHENKELPFGMNFMETNRKSYDFAMDARWNALNAEIKTREELLKKSSETDKDFFDGFGEIVPKVNIKHSSTFRITQK